MQPLDNPYAPGAGVPPPEIAGRDEEIAAVELLLARAVAGRPFRSPLLTGLRGTGKTVLLNRYVELAREAGWAVAIKEIPGERNDAEPFRALMAGLARKAILELSMARSLKERGTRLARVFTSFIQHLEIRTPEGYSLGLDLEPARGVADSGVLNDDLADLFTELGEVARDHDAGVLFALDEVQNLGRSDLSALIVALHRVSQRQLPVAVVAAGLPQLPTLAAEVQTYAERLFDFRPISRLEATAASAALADPAQALGVEWESAALAAAVTGSDRWPYFLQEWGEKAWASAESSPITVADVQRSAPLVEAALDRGFYEARYGRATDKERAYILAMASAGDGPYESGSVATALESTQKATSWLRDALIRKGLIYSPRLGQLDFTVPGFAAFLRRREPATEATPPLSSLVTTHGSGLKDQT